MSKHLSLAVKVAGGQTALAEKLTGVIGKKVRQGSIWIWLHRSKKGVPAEYCPAIEAVTGGKVKREDLRPDIWGKA